MKCCWVLVPARPGVQAKYCGEVCRFKIQLDRYTGRKCRVYEHFCEKHREAAEQQE